MVMFIFIVTQDYLCPLIAEHCAVYVVIAGPRDQLHS